MPAQIAECIMDIAKPKRTCRCPIFFLLGEIHVSPAQKPTPQSLRPGNRIMAIPQMVEAAPPSNSHMVLSVGFPVKVREILELTELEAWEP